MLVLVPADAGGDYAHAQPSLTAKKLRKLELIAGAKHYDRSAAGIWTANRAVRDAEEQLARQTEASYVPLAATAPKKSGRERDTGARIK